MPLQFKYLTLNYPFPSFQRSFPLLSAEPAGCRGGREQPGRWLPFGGWHTPLGEEDDSEVTRLGTLTAPVWGPRDSSARPGRDRGWGEVRNLLFKDRVRLQQAAWLAGGPA